MKRRIALLALLSALTVASLGGCFFPVPRAAQRAADKVEEKIEKNAEKFGESMEEWAENFSGDMEEWADSFSQYAELGENLAQVDVYDAATGKLLHSITKEETLRSFEKTLGNAVDKHFNSYKDAVRMIRETFTTPKNETEEYRFDLYQASVAAANKGELYKVMSITTYADSSLITIRVEADVVKGSTIPKNFLTMTLELKKEAMEQLRALASQ